MRRGVSVTLCTGRMYSGTRHIAQRLGLSRPVACIDGSHIVDVTTNQELASVPLSGGGVAALLEVLGRHDSASFVFSGDRVYFDGNGQRYLSYVTTWSEQTHELPSVLDAAHWVEERPMAALVALGSERDITAAYAALGAHEEHLQATCFPVKRASFSGIWGIVVRAARVDKGTALEWFAEHHGVTPEEVIAIGDWLNDIPMLRRAGRSFAMAQAPDEVKAAATDVLDADIWQGGGLAEAAERAGLL